MLLFTPARRFRCHADSRELLRLFLINVLLNIVTLGVYRFWGKTRMRHYLWSHTSFDGERFMYTGQGQELFRGFLLAFAVTSGLLIASQKVSSFFLTGEPDVEPLVRLLISYLLYILIGAGLYGARRYILSRSQWRGIRFAQSGSAAAYAKTWISTQGLSVLTLGLYTPFMRHHLFSHTLNNTWFGSEPVMYDGEGKDLFTRFLKPYLLLIPTLGLSWFWYRAAEYRYLAEHTQVQGVRFATTISGSDLLRLTIGNGVLLIGTLGLAYPFTLLRKIQVLSEHTWMIGDFDYARILQNEQYVPTNGEGLVGVFGMGSI